MPRSSGLSTESDAENVTNSDDATPISIPVSATYANDVDSTRAVRRGGTAVSAGFGGPSSQPSRTGPFPYHTSVQQKYPCASRVT
jgi:hypothetical protein